MEGFDWDIKRLNLPPNRVVVEVLRDGKALEVGVVVLKGEVKFGEGGASGSRGAAKRRLEG